MLNKHLLFLSIVSLLPLLSAAVCANEHPETVRQSMQCSIQSETQTVYPHKGKTKGSAYGILAGIGIGIATSGSSTFFYILAAGIGAGAVADHVDYKDGLQQNYERCLKKVAGQKTESANPVPDFAKPRLDVISSPNVH